MAPSDTNYLYASRGSALYVSTNGGATWVTRTAPGTITDICVHRTIPSKIYITTSAASNNVQVSTNAGATFTSISAGLPALGARSVAIENNAVQGLYVGLNTGVYYKNDTMSAWLNYSGNLPMVSINELEIQYAAARLRVATYGRGLWDAPLFVAGSVPVKWLLFNAKKNEGENELNWKVTGEHSRTRYEVQRSRNGRDFSALGTLPAKGQQVSEYRFTDRQPLPGINYYRIKETDDGREYYSRIISLRNDNNNQFLEVSPNPVTGGVLRFGFVNTDAQTYDVQVVNMAGRMMLMQKQTDSYGTLDIGYLPAGTYYLVVKKDKEVYKQAFVKAD